jgi:hypothetical protein
MALGPKRRMGVENLTEKPSRNSQILHLKATRVSKIRHPNTITGRITQDVTVHDQSAT